MKNKVKIVGITGGIGSGKSFVCKKFEEFLNIEVYYSDRRVQDDIMKRPHIIEEVEYEFGHDSYIDGEINKDKFRKLLFNNKRALRIMNEITLPEMLEDINKWVKDKTCNYVLVECAVIFENDIDYFFDKIITVVADEDVRIDRLIKSRGLTKDSIKSIMSNQVSDNECNEKSDYVINNDGDLIKQIHDINFSLKE